MNDQFSYNSRRIEKTFDYMNKNFDRTITLSEVSKLSNMSDVSFSRFFKQRTGNTFIDSLTEIRLGHASRILIDSTNSIAEVAYHCGFTIFPTSTGSSKRKKAVRRVNSVKVFPEHVFSFNFPPSLFFNKKHHELLFPGRPL
ncbi:MAG: AraC family transcriptional regulator [Puia sp.]